MFGADVARLMRNPLTSEIWDEKIHIHPFIEYEYAVRSSVTLWQFTWQLPGYQNFTHFLLPAPDSGSHQVYHAPTLIVVNPN